ncbi:MAG: hypothetical protein IT436_04630 [Phycisphaerales bacterium]|nr:hypothetical protein [Phycisphaerales bacterium]
MSPSVHPAMAEHLAPEFVIGTNEAGSIHHPAYTAGLATMGTLWATSAGLAEAEAAIKAAGTDPASERRLRAGAEASLSKARKAAEGALGAIAQHREQTESAITEALGVNEARQQVTTALRASAIHANLSRITDSGKRSDELRAILAEGDAESAAAILAAPARASGLTAKQYAEFRRDAEQRFAPKVVALRDSLDKLRTVVERADRLTFQRFGGLIGLGGTPAGRVEASLRALENGGEQ